MTHQPDNLFREKLENLRLNAPENAWSRIEAGLDKSSYKGLWMKIAAGLVLLAVAGVLIWKVTGKEETNLLASQTTPEKTEVMKDEPAHANSPTLEPSVEQAIAVQEENKKEFPKTVKEKKNGVTTVNENYIAVTTTSPENPEEMITSPETSIAEATNLETLEVSTKTQSGVYLVYTAEEVNQKYLRNLPEDDATQESKKSSRIQMLMGVAMNLKNGDSGLGDLRQMKDEIFALNFLDDKKQSKKN